MSSNSANAPALGSTRAETPPAANGSGSQKSLASLMSAWWPVALGIAVILVESTAMMGADHTSGPLRMIVESIFGHIADDRWEIVHHYIRKSGHFVGYGLLCLAWLRAWRLTFPPWRFPGHAGLALLGTAVVASCDEWHQSFLPNRTSSPWDVLLDCCGGAVMTLIAAVVLRIIQVRRLAQ